MRKLLLLIMVFSSLTSFAQQSSSTISAITINVENPIDEDEVSELLTFLSRFKGQMAQQESLDSVTRELKGLNRYETIACDFSSAEDSQTRLQCDLKRFLLLQRVEFKNLPLILLETDLQKRVALKPGLTLDINAPTFSTSLARLRDTTRSFLENAGYFGFELTTSVVKINDTPTANIVVEIIGGNFVRVRNVTLAHETVLAPKILTQPFKEMCHRLRNAIDGLLRGTSACYSRSLEEETAQNVESQLEDMGYIEADLSLRRHFIDPHAKDAGARCSDTRPDASPKCVDLEIYAYLGPKLEVNYEFPKDAQTIYLVPVTQFLRNIFGIEFFSRALNISFVGAKYPADETILLNQLDQALTFKSEKLVFDREIESSIAALKTVLATRGYPKATVFAKSDFSDPNFARITFQIDPKEPEYVQNVTFKSQTHVGLDLAQTSNRTVVPRGLFNSGHYTDADLNTDTDNIKSLYLGNGYADVSVAAQAVADNRRVQIAYDVESANGQEQLKEIELIDLPKDPILSAISSLTSCKNPEIDDKGQNLRLICGNSPYVPGQIEFDRLVLTSALNQSGYLYAKTESTTQRSGTDYSVQFKLENPDTPRVRSKGLLVDGNAHTLRGAIEREMGVANTEPGTYIDPYQLNFGLANLRKSGVFSKVSLQYDGQEEKDSEVFLHLSVSEKPTFTLDTALAFSTDQLFSVGASINERNLFGAMLRLETALQLGFFIGRQSYLKNTFQWPQIFGKPMIFELKAPEIYYDKNLQESPASLHNLIRVQAAVRWEFLSFLFPYLEYSLRLDRWLTLADQDPRIQTLGIENLDGLVLALNAPSTARGILTPGVSLIAVDNVFNPKNGFRVYASTELSQKTFGADLAYAIFNLKLFGYKTFGPVTFAAQAGVRRAVIYDPERNWWILQYQSNMTTLGGDQGLRGYPDGGVGIYGEQRDSVNGDIILQNGSPLLGFHPGNLQLTGNFETRFLLAENFWGGAWEFALFTDFGFVGICEGSFACFDKRGMNTSDGQNWQLGWSVGPSLRYLLPLGPLSLDYGISPIHEGSGIFGRQARIHFQFGYSF